jgi:hypothetical protein
VGAPQRHGRNVTLPAPQYSVNGERRSFRYCVPSLDAASLERVRTGVTIDELGIEVHFVKEAVVLSEDYCSSDKFMHGIKVLMAKNYIDNLGEEVRKGMIEKVTPDFHWVRNWDRRGAIFYWVRQRRG